MDYTSSENQGLQVGTMQYSRARDILGQAMETFLVPRGRAPFGQHQEPPRLDLDRPSEIPVLMGFANT